jgi:hypothetical protein
MSRIAKLAQRAGSGQDNPTASPPPVLACSYRVNATAVNLSRDANVANRCRSHVTAVRSHHNLSAVPHTFRDAPEVMHFLRDKYVGETSR